MVLAHHDGIKLFRSSLPYINAHQGKTFVLMFGGEAIEHPNFPNIIHDIALLNSLGVRVVVVHGARPQIDQRAANAERKGVEVSEDLTGSLLGTWLGREFVSTLGVCDAGRANQIRYDLECLNALGAVQG